MSETMAVVDSRDIRECIKCGKFFETFSGVCQHYRLTHEGDIYLRENCDSCGEKIIRKPGDFHPESDHYFCSESCHSEWLSKERRDRIEVECEMCGKCVEKKPSHVERADRSFCSTECKGDWMSENRTGENSHQWKGGKATQVCDQCGDEYELCQSRAGETDNNFCSMSCYGDWASENRTGDANPNYRWDSHESTTCDYCSDEFEYHPSSVPGKYCSYTCARKDKTGSDHLRWTGGRPTYGEGWDKEKREAVRRRDDMECQVCGVGQEEHKEETNKKLHVHHKIPAKEIDESAERNKMSNLVTLCISCHMSLEVSE